MIPNTVIKEEVTQLITRLEFLNEKAEKKDPKLNSLLGILYAVMGSLEEGTVIEMFGAISFLVKMKMQSQERMLESIPIEMMTHH